MDDARQNKLLNAFPSSEFVGIIHRYKQGFSGAPVLAAQYRPLMHSQAGKYGLNGTFIVKIGSEDWANAEQAFYNKVADDTALAPLLVHFQMTSMPVDGMKAVAYEVAFASLSVPQPLITILDARNYEEAKARQQIKNLSRALVDWYLASKTGERNIVQSQRELILHMLTQKRVRDLRERLSKNLPFWNSTVYQISVEGLKQQLPNPLVFLNEATWKNIQYKPNCPIGRIHGDLQTGNVICDPELQSDPKLIDFDPDFEDGVPFFDLAYLEFDIMRHLLPVEQKEKRSHWLPLLDFSMAHIGGGGPSSDWDAARAWDFIQPIREGVQRLQTSYGKDYEILWWLATVAVGLNFARKGDDERLRFERMAGLLYAAYGLDQVLESNRNFGYNRINDGAKEAPLFVPWLREHGDFGVVPELSLPPPPQASVHTDIPAHAIEPIPNDVPSNIPKLLSEQPQSVLPVEQSQLDDLSSSIAPPDSIILLSNAVSPSVLTSTTQEEQTSKNKFDVRNNSADTANSIQSLLQHSLADFRGGGLIYQSICDELGTALRKLGVFLHEQKQKIHENFYDIKLPIDNIIEAQEKLLDALYSFREACLPLNTKTLSQTEYERERNAISQSLDKILYDCTDLFKKLQ